MKTKKKYIIFILKLLFIHLALKHNIYEYSCRKDMLGIALSNMWKNSEIKKDIT